MKTFKRIASLILAIAMIAAMVVVPVSAAEVIGKLWDFEDNKVPSEFAAPFGAVADGVLSSRGRRVHTIQIGTIANPIGVTMAEYPYFEANWRYWVYSGTEDAARRQMYMNIYEDVNGKATLVIQLQFDVDVNGQKVSDTMAVHTYEFAKGVVTSKGTATTIAEALDKEIAYIAWQPWNKMIADETNKNNYGAAEIDYIKIFGYDMDVAMAAPNVVYSGDTAEITATVTGNTPEKVEFYVDGELVETDTTAPYSLSHKCEGEKKVNVKAVAKSGDKTAENSVSIEVIKSGRADFNTFVPSYIGRTGATITENGEFVYTGSSSATINIGTPSYSFIKGGFDPTVHKYIKMRAKLNGTAKSDPYMMSFNVMPVGSKTGYGTQVANKDFNGNVFTTEYQQFVFDITECLTPSNTKIDFTGKTAGWIQFWFMRKTNPGTLTIDWIEFSDDPTVEVENPTIVTLAADKTTVISGEKINLTASYTGTAPEKVEFYADGKLFDTDDEAPFEASYTVTGEKNYNFTAKGISDVNASESAGISVISYNELRFDFNVIPPSFFGPSAVLNGDGTVTISGSRSTGINIGMPDYPIKTGGFDPKEYRFIKMRAKLTGTAYTDSYTISYTLRPVGQKTGGITLTHPKDENGRILSSEWQELVFDMSKAGSAGGTPTEDGIYGWLQMLALRKTDPGELTIDYIELSKDPIVTLTANKSGVYREGVEVTLDAGVAGVDASSIKFYDGNKLIGEDSSAPYSITYTAMGEEKHEFTARVETANGTIKSLPSYVSTYTEMRFDFNTVIPPNFQAGKATMTLDGEGAVKIEGANSTMLNVGRPENPLKVGGFDPTDYKYMKIRAKLLGTPKSDTYALSLGMFDIDSTVSYGTFTYKTDMYGKTFTEEYQELVFDLTNGIDPATGEAVDISGKRAGWLQIMPMRKANPAVMYIDYIEFISAKPYKIGTPELAGDEILTSTILNDNMDDVVDTENIVYIAAKYNGNDLTDVKLQPVTLTEMEEATTPIDVSAMEIADGERIDVMAVKSFSDMTPIMEKVTVYDNGISAKDATFAGAFMDHMVLQRDMPVNVWGKADAADGGVLEISFAGNTVSAVVEDGKWEAKLPALEASAEPQVLSVKSLSGVKEITDVLVGDVYFVAGQSNAAFTLNGTDTWEEDRAGAVAEDNIRILFSAKNAYSEEKRDTPYDKAVWQPAVNIAKEDAAWDEYGHTMINFPAIGYYMADTLRADGVDVPLGLVSIAKSGATLAAISPAHLSEGISDGYKAQAYNAYIAPVENMTVKAMLWYQGESDANDRCAPTYAERFSNFVDYMRGKTGNDDMAVFMVQLSSHSDQPDGTASSWQLGKMRSIQADMVLNKTIDNLYMVASLDKGWKNGDSDIAHPRYKKPVGQRLAKVVENVFYNGENVTMPMPVAVTFGEGVCTIEFDKNLTESTEVLGFELIKDGVAYAATIAEAYENVVDIAVENEVLCENIADGVRYAFYNAASPLVANLRGENGLHAPTFAIDNPDADVEIKAAYIAPISLGKVE